MLELIKVNGTAASDYIADECDICHTQDMMVSDGTGVGVRIVHDTKLFVETESLVYKCLLDTQEATDLFHHVTIFRE